MKTNDQDIQLTNSELAISVHPHGAELCSIKHQGTEYLWQADPKFWSRHSPVLFPIVGAVWNNTYRVEGKEYQLSQHGFARDMDFEIVSVQPHEAWFKLESNADTLQKYPFPFALNIGYEIEGNKIHVKWRVYNPSDNDMHFQIGAHPAFYYQGEPKEDVKGYFRLKPANHLQFTLIQEKGCADTAHHHALTTEEDGLLPITKETFSRDALIFEEAQLEEVTLCDADKHPYLKVAFHTPLVGLWAPSAESPFVCIEPWYGRCDKAGFEGEYKDKDWMQTLQSHQTFEGGYTIEIL